MDGHTTHPPWFDRLTTNGPAMRRLEHSLQSPTLGSGTTLHLRETR